MSDQSVDREGASGGMMRGKGVTRLIVVSMVGFVVWLIFILFFALDWSRGYSLFQNVRVFLVSMCVTGALIGLMWMVWGRDKMGQMWGDMC